MISKSSYLPEEKIEEPEEIDLDIELLGLTIEENPNKKDG